MKIQVGFRKKIFGKSQILKPNIGGYQIIGIKNFSEPEKISEVENADQ